MPKVFVSVGSNINRRDSIGGGLRSLQEKVTNLQLSSVYETEAVGFRGDHFYNLVIAFDTELTPAGINSLLKRIEKKYGRKSGSRKFASRTLDMDLLLYDDLILDENGLQIPRNEIFKYAFVLEPLVEMIADKKCPGIKQTYSQLWEDFKETKNPVPAMVIDWDPLS